MTTGTETQPDLITKVEEVLAKHVCVNAITLTNSCKWNDHKGCVREWCCCVCHDKFDELAPDLLRRLVEEVKTARRSSTDVVIQKIQIMQEKHPGQRIELSVEPDGYCYVTRVDANGKARAIAEGATMGDVFED